MVVRGAIALEHMGELNEGIPDSVTLAERGELGNLPEPGSVEETRQREAYDLFAGYLMGGPEEVTRIEGRLNEDPLLAASFDILKYQLLEEQRPPREEAPAAEFSSGEVPSAKPVEETLRRMASILSTETPPPEAGMALSEWQGHQARLRDMLAHNPDLIRFAETFGVTLPSVERAA